MKKNILESAFVRMYSLKDWGDMCETVTEFSQQEGIEKRDYGKVLTKLKNLETSKLTRYEWFIILDALGNDDLGHVEKNDVLKSFYELAGEKWETMTVQYFKDNPKDYPRMYTTVIEEALNPKK